MYIQKSHLFFLLFITILLCDATCYIFEQKPRLTLLISNDSGSCIKISPDQQYILVGFQTGQLKLFNINGTTIKQNIFEHKNSITKIQWCNNDWIITLDSNGIAYKWNGLMQNPMKYDLIEQKIYDISLTYIRYGKVSAYVALNVGTSVKQYSLLTDQLHMQYFPIYPDIQMFTYIQYSQQPKYLWVSTNTSKIYLYSQSNGKLYDKWTLENRQTISYLNLIKYYNYTDVLLVTNYFNLIFINSTSENYYENLRSLSEINDLKTCTGRPYMIVINKNKYNMDVFNSTSGGYIEEVNYFQGFPKGVDCSFSYLVSIDSKGIMYINEYQGGSWIVLIIFGIIVIGMFGVFIFKVCKDKMNTTKDYNKVSNNGTMQAGLTFTQSQNSLNSNNNFVNVNQFGYNNQGVYSPNYSNNPNINVPYYIPPPFYNQASIPQNNQTINTTNIQSNHQINRLNEPNNTIQNPHLNLNVQQNKHLLEQNITNINQTIIIDQNETSIQKKKKKKEKQKSDDFAF